MSLSGSYTFIGKGNWSLDAVGGSATGGGAIQVDVPTGSKIEKAFLYETTYSTQTESGSVKLSSGASSLALDSAAFTGLGSATAAGLIAYRADVTAYVSSVVGSGSAVDFDFNISDISGSRVDGFVLAVVYSNPNETTRTIAFLDGASAAGGDSFTVNFAKPIDTSVAGFSAEMSLGIGFSFQSGSDQYSTVKVNDRLLTSSAGGSDDGSATNGGLVTVGGLGDDPANPADPTRTALDDPRLDDELYDLAKGSAADPTPYIANGATSIKVDTLNPSNNDNIFFAGFNITAEATVDSGGNDAPIAVADGFTTNEDTALVLSGFLLNDTDPDGDTLQITGIDTTGLKGTLVNNGDGTYTYNPNGKFEALNNGDTATDSFAYTISDGNGGTASATVTINVKGVTDDNGPQPPSDCPTVARPGTVDGSDPSNQVLIGPGYHNTFYFDVAGNSGKDEITNFAKDDIVVTNQKLYDANNDGFVTFGANSVLDFDGPNAGVDTVKFDGLDPSKGLRYLGEACTGSFVYADATVRPFKAIEGTVRSDTLTGDAGDKKANVFFYDTALDINLGQDTIKNFGAKDIFVTTSKVTDVNKNGIVSFGANDRIDLSGGTGGPDDPGASGEVGSVGVTGINGAKITSFEFDGMVTQNGVDYYVYSLVGSAAGTGNLVFA